jgi:FixJ family two-component response regulator
MITGHAEKKRVLAARDAGVSEFLVKPITAKALHSRVLSAVAKPRPFIRTAQYFGPDRRRHADKAHTGPERRKNRTPNNP